MIESPPRICHTFDQGGSNMDANQLVNYLENLRYERNITQEEFIHGVISNRQYFRYRNNESEVPFSVIQQLSERLGISIFRLMTQFQEEQQKERKLVREYINAVINQNIEKAESEYEKIRDAKYLDVQNQKFVKLGNELVLYYRKRISQIELVARIKEIICLDEIINRTSIHDAELYMLGMLMQHSEKDREFVLEYILNLYHHHKLMTGGNPIFISQVYFWILKNLGREERYEELIEISKMAIEHNKKNYSYYAMEHFYYYRALAFRKLNNEPLFQKNLIKTIEILQVLSDEKRQKYYEIIMKDLGIDARSTILN